MNFWPCYSGDYFRDTADLSAMEHGMYFLLLCFAYSTEKPLPVDLHRLCRMVRACDDDEREALRTVAERFFPVGADGLRHNDRVDAEIVIANRKKETARLNGCKGGRPKTKKEPAGFKGGTQTEPGGFAASDPHAQPNANPADSSPSPSPSPSPCPSVSPSRPDAVASPGDISPALALDPAFEKSGSRETAIKSKGHGGAVQVFEAIPRDLVKRSGGAT